MAAMDLVARFRQFLDCYAAKDLAGISKMLAPSATLRDWNLSVRGQAAVEAETQRNFDNARSIAIEVLRLHESERSVAGELRIVVDGDIELFVVDVLDFDGEGRIAAIRSYKGRGD
jgi:steroid delta-isomerase